MWVRFNLSTYKSEVIPRAELDKAEAVFQARKVGQAMEELDENCSPTWGLKVDIPIS